MRTTRERFLGLFLLGSLAAISGGCNMLSGRMSNREGMTYYRDGNYAMAREHFKRAAADEPWNADYIHNLASAMRKQGDVAGAEQVYRHALNVDPSHHPSYHGLALLLNEQGRQPEAHELLTMWSETQPYTPSPHIEMAWLQRESGDVAGAEHSLHQALKVQPDHPKALAHLGQIYQDSGQNDRAVAMYQRSLHAERRQPQVQSRLASLRQPQQPGWRPSSAPVMAVHPVPHGTPVAGFPVHHATAPQVVMQPGPVFGPVETVVSGPRFPEPVVGDADPAHTHQIGSDLPAVEAH